MDYVFKASFEDKPECKKCMLAFYHASSDRNKCAALGNRPLCPEEGCRKDCPLEKVN